MPATSIQTCERQTERAPTIKKRATAEEIQADLQGRIARSMERDGACRGCEAPLPHPAKFCREGEPNWFVEGLPGLAPGCFGTIVRIVDQARLEYELVS